MKSTIIIIVMLISFSGMGQNNDFNTITGNWEGSIQIQGFDMKVIFKIINDKGQLRATMDVPVQGGFDIPSDSVGFEDNHVRINFDKFEAVYKGKLETDSLYITGYWYQAGQQFELDLKPRIKINHPQEPKKPYDYREEKITFKNKKAGIDLAGTLTLPSTEGSYPVAVLITGSGAENRNEEILGHKPFLIIADYLTKNGIAVLRFDDRGTGESGGKFAGATSADFATDVEAAMDYLKTRKQINKKKIGLIGHSEGGMIAPMVASHRKDVAFILSLAGPGIKGSELMVLQNYELGKARGMDDKALESAKEINKRCYEIVCSEKSDSLKTEELKKILGEEGLAVSEMGAEIKGLISPWYTNFLKTDPQIYLKKTRCPFLALNGEKDVQVPAKENLPAIEKALKDGGNKNVTIKSFPELNHLFQHATTGLPAEYEEIEETFSPEVLKVMGDWIKEVTK